MATSGICNSAKVELMQGLHCFNATQTAVTTTNSTSTSYPGMASTAGLAVGMSITGTNVGAGSVISAVVNATTVTSSVISSGAATSVTFTADAFKMLLIKAGPGRTYDNTQSNIGIVTGAGSVSNVGTDEVTGTGYVAGGVALVNSTPSLPGTPSTTATTTFATISWTSATITATAGIIYNTTARGGAGATPVNNRTFAVLDFGGSQTVTNGTFSVTFPGNLGNTAILQLA